MEEKSIIDLASSKAQHPKRDNLAGEGESTPQRPSPASDASLQGSNKSKEMQEVMDSLLENVTGKTGWVSVQLPSNGVLKDYNSDTVEVRPFTYEDERNLRSISQGGDAMAAMSALIKGCVRGVDPENLVIQDSTYVFFKLRALSYGNTYPIVGDCVSCGAKNELVVELDKLVNTPLDPNFEEPFPVVLPDSGKTAYIKLPRAKHESFLESAGKITENLWRFVDKIEEHSDRMIIQTFIKKTTVRDIDTLRTAILKSDFGLDTNVHFVCSQCGEHSQVILPLTQDFFSAS